MCQEQLEIGDFKVLRCSGGRKVSGGCLEFTTKLSRGCMNASMVSGVCLGVFRHVLEGSNQMTSVLTTFEVRTLK